MVATTRDLRFKTSALLSAVKHGEDVVITFRGKPAARLVPYRRPSPNSRRGDLSALFGMWSDHTKTADVAAYVRSLRKGRFS